MGHQLLGKLPAHSSLPEIIRFLVTGGTPTDDLVDQITDFGKDALKEALKDPVFIRALWLLVRIPQAMAAEDSVPALQSIGLDGGEYASVADILIDFDNGLERTQREPNVNTGDLGELARQAALSALGNRVTENLPTLWEANSDDVRAALSKLRAPEQFGALAQEFMANFVDRTIHYSVDRDLSRMVGPDRVSRSLNGVENFDAAISRHCGESSLIMRAFAKDWLGKNHFHEGKAITEKSIRSFAAHTVTKMQAELDVRRGKV
jgi:hypothetical protein